MPHVARMNAHYGLVQSVAPAEEPITLAEAKTHMRVETDYTDENSLIEDALIPAARQYCETVTGRQFITATWVMKMDEFPRVIWLPRPPALTVTSITYVDTAGDSQTVTAANYTLDTYATKARITEAYGEVWPSTQSIANAVTVTYTAGYGAASTVPESLKAAIKMVVADMYEHRLAQHELPGRMEIVDNPAVARLLATETVLEAA